MRNASRATSSGGIAWISGREASLIQSTSSGSESEGKKGSPRSSLSAHSGVPEGDVTEHGGDRPVLVDRSAKLGRVQAFDEGAEALTLSRVQVDVRPVLRHASATIPAGDGDHQGMSRTSASNDRQS